MPLIRLTHEIFFVAEIGLSTPARRVLKPLGESRRHVSHIAREQIAIREILGAQALFAFSMSVDADRCCISCITASPQRRACAWRTRTFRPA
jgi:hypothetical protein